MISLLAQGCARSLSSESAPVAMTAVLLVVRGGRDGSSEDGGGSFHLQSSCHIVGTPYCDIVSSIVLCRDVIAAMCTPRQNS